MKNKIFNLAKKIINNEIRSKFLRVLFKKIHSVDVGMYSYGCFDKKRIPKNTTIGRYCSFAQTAYIFNANHPKHYLSLHPFFYNPDTGFLDQTTITRTQLIIEDDVWLGHNSTILAGVTKIGRGAIVAAGAVVTSNVPPYAIMAGIPAKQIGQRFPDKIINEIEQSRWWLLNEKDLKNELKTSPNKFFKPTEFFDNV
ncbi:Streptogramin A acetyltransferase [compost metagenome]